MMPAIEQVAQRRARQTLDHVVWIDERKHVDAGRWCRLHFGKRWEAIGHRDGVWACFWGGQGAHWLYRFCFAQEADAVVFALKWA